MNTPNRLTLARIILSPILLFFLLMGSLPHNYFWALLIFVGASITDMLDGQIARQRNLVTTFGQFLDPLADKMLITAALLGLMENGLCNVWVIMIVLTREFLVTSIRLVASGKGKVIPASGWGKAKTISQMLAVIAILVMKEAEYLTANGIWTLLPTAFPIEDISQVLLWISTAFTIVSGMQYLWEYRHYIDTK